MPTFAIEEFFMNNLREFLARVSFNVEVEESFVSRILECKQISFSTAEVDRSEVKFFDIKRRLDLVGTLLKLKVKEFQELERLAIDIHQFMKEINNHKSLIEGKNNFLMKGVGCSIFTATVLNKDRCSLANKRIITAKPFGFDLLWARERFFYKADTSLCK